MHLNIFPSSPLFLVIIICLFSLLFPKSIHGYDERFSYCSSPFDCGKIRGLGYPFWRHGRPDYCGHPGFKLDCEEDNATIEIMSRNYSVINVNLHAGVLKIARMDFLEGICPDQFVNTTLNFTLFGYTPSDVNTTLLYNCLPPQHMQVNSFSCLMNKVLHFGYLVIGTDHLPNELASRCNLSVVVPIVGNAGWGLTQNSSNISAVLNEGFEVGWIVDESQCGDCLNSGGICGYNWTLDEPCCFCPDQAYPRSCPHPPVPATPPIGMKSPATPPIGMKSPRNKFNWGLKLGIGFGAAGVSIMLMCLIFFIYHRRNKKHYTASPWVSRIISSYSSSMSDLEKAGVQMFSYGELEEATKNFDSKKELGDGGFGTVYQGKLRDGRVVAVKRLYENNFKRVEQFRNEVEILTRLRHQNLVSLYGCSSRHCRELLLVYEYIPNGTVADHLHGDLAKPGSLTWTTRMSIAIETASALTYLHASDVIHRDVKTNNILLDNNFSVKVADFGLSRLFPIDVTHVSTAPQGTPGYVDPEYHECYQLTDKSDVYSFGVVLVELISSKPAVDITRHRHEINLSNMAINKIQNRALHELVDPCLDFESDYKVRKMITDVAELAFQCLQNGREMRPSMEEVLETLRTIQNDIYDTKKAEEVDFPADDVVLLKNDPAALSPDSVTANWVSKSTTPNASG